MVGALGRPLCCCTFCFVGAAKCSFIIVGCTNNCCNMKSSIALLVSLAILPTAGAESHPAERPIRIKNESGGRAEVHWVHPDSGEYVLLKGMMDGQTLSLK